MKVSFTRFLLFLTLFFSSAFAEEMFWEVNGTKGSKVYLLGSIHLGDESLYPLDKKIYDIFRKSNYLFLETSISEDTQILLNEQLYKKKRLDDNDSIKNYITPTTYNDLREWIKDLNLGPTSMDRYLPAVAAVTLSLYDFYRFGYSSDLGIEKHFMVKAKYQNKPIYGLESVWSQIKLLSDDNKSYQEAFLQSQMSVRFKSQGEVDTMFVNYKEGNISYFNTLVASSLESYPSIKESLVTKRNEYMYKKVLKYLANRKGRKYFIIVGLAHLIGEEGILAKLRADGYSVTRY